MAEDFPHTFTQPISALPLSEYAALIYSTTTNPNHPNVSPLLWIRFYPAQLRLRQAHIWVAFFMKLEGAVLRGSLHHSQPVFHRRRILPDQRNESSWRL